MTKNRNKPKIDTNKYILLGIVIAVAAFIGSLFVLSTSATGVFRIYTSPSGISADLEYTVLVEGQDSFVYSTPYGAFTSYEQDSGSVLVTVNPTDTVQNVNIRPSNLNISASITSGGDALTFNIDQAGKYSVEVNGQDYPLFIFANTPDTNIPSKTDPNVQYFEAGQVYDVGELILKSNKSVYIEGGAVLKGKIRTGTCCTSGATESNIAIRGPGVVDSTSLADPGRPLRINRSDNVLVDGPVFLGTQAWGVVAFESNYVDIKNIKVINWLSSEGGTPDGIDVVGSKNVAINDVFVRSYDDGIAIKNDKFGWAGDVEAVTIDGAVIWNGDAGNGLEIGYENNANYIRNIRYKNVDIIHKTARPDPYKRAAISIHNIDGAPVSDVVYEDIRIEQSQENYIYLSTFKTSSSATPDEGKISDVTFRNIAFTGAPKALPVVLSGFESPNDIDGVIFEDLSFDGQTITDSNQLDLQKINANNIQFISTNNGDNADINNDGRVDIVDLSILLSAWNTNSNGADLDTSGSVDIVDLSILLSKWSS